MEIIGREPELARLRDFLSSPGTIVLEGGPGFGKTTLWEAGVELARERGLRVCAARPSGAEAQLSFAALTDLLDDVEDLSALPAPQRHALEVALLRAEATGPAAEPHAIGLAVRNVLRELAPVVVAIDDVQWLDPPSGEALAFAARRLGGDAVTFLLAARPGPAPDLVQALERAGVERLAVGPLSLGAIRRLLFERLGLSLVRPALRAVVEAAHGNPLFALELGRTVAARGVPRIGEEMPLPEDLLGARVEQLDEPARRLLLAVALSAGLRPEQLAGVDDAVAAGLLVVESGRLRPAHPLLAAAARARSTAGERRELHRELAGAVTDQEQRARHLALAADAPDAELAATVAAAAEQAATRGARGAAELAAHALRLTPAGSPDRPERLLTLGRHLSVAGEHLQVTAVLAGELDSLPPGEARVRAHLLLIDGGEVESADDYERHLKRAYAAAEGDPGLVAAVLGRRAMSMAVAYVERIADAEALALEVLPAAREAGEEVEQIVVHSIAWTRVLRGRAVDDLGAGGEEDNIFYSLARIVAIRLGWRGEVAEARRRLEALRALADERGETWSYVALRLHLCELALRAGDLDEAGLLLDEMLESTDDGLLIGPVYERCRALHAACRGDVEDAERWVERTLAGTETAGVRWEWLEAQRARGVAALLARDAARAAESLGLVWEHCLREGVDEPGAFPVAPDLVEALTALGVRDEALAVTTALRDAAERLDHPWGRVSARRCDAVVRLAAPEYDEPAAEALAAAAEDYAALGLRFDAARSWLSLGRAQRRLRKWAAARAALSRAADGFDGAGAPGWADDARAELARVGGRGPRAAGDLTPTERRTAELAAEGLSNKEIARTLVVTVHTVEVHLSKAYAKLGVRSRSQLAARLAPKV
ncbi:MAG TPA: AAA family ATPase [Solirubrobacteraceae bacterium]|nr:AAA family ATPase [Solirubrobacteraceae bacterium]